MHSKHYLGYDLPDVLPAMHGPAALPGAEVGPRAPPVRNAELELLDEARRARAPS